MISAGDPTETSPGQSRVIVTGDGGTVAALTWGQRAILHTVLAMGPGSTYFTIVRPVRLARPVSPEMAGSALRELVAAHHALRTVVSGTGAAAVQRLVPRAAVPVHHVTSDGPVDVEILASVGRELKARPWDLQRDVPVRAALVHHAGAVHAVVLALCHLAVDAAAVDVLETDLRALVDGGPLAGTPRWQPTDQAAFEATPAAVTAGARAVERWRDIIRRLPPQDPGPTAGAADRFQEWEITCPRAAAAADLLARQAQVSVASAVLASWCVATGTTSGDRTTAAVTLISGNRRRPREHGHVGPLAQDALFEVGWEVGTPMDELMRSVHRRALVAYSAGRYDPVALAAVLPRDADGSPVKVRTFFNCTSGPTTPIGPAHPPVPAAAPRLRGHWPHLDLTRFLVMRHTPAGALNLRLLADTAITRTPTDLLLAVRNGLLDAVGATV